MDVPLKPELEKFVQEQVEAGCYGSAVAVFEDALTRMMEDVVGELGEDALYAIDEAEDQIDNGQHHDWKKVSGELRAKHLGK